MKKKYILILLIFIPVCLLFIGVFPFIPIEVNIGITFPCACATTKMIVNGDRERIKEELNIFKMKYKVYPTYESLVKILKKDNEHMFDYKYVYIKKYKPKIKVTNSSVYYKRIHTGKDYILKGYAKGKLLGKDIIVDVTDENKTVVFDYL